MGVPDVRLKSFKTFQNVENYALFLYNCCVLFSIFARSQKSRKIIWENDRGNTAEQIQTLG